MEGQADKPANQIGHLAHFLPLFDHLYLGGTHDSGYATTLSSPLGAELSRKISLLQTTPAFAPNLAKLELTIVDARKWNLYDGRDPNNGKRHDMPRKDRAEPDQEEEAAKVNEVSWLCFHNEEAQTQLTSLC